MGAVKNHFHDEICDTADNERNAGKCDEPKSILTSGWLVDSGEGGWDWVSHRIAAVAALTEGRRVFNLAKREWA